MKIFVDGSHGAAGVCLIEKLEKLAQTHDIQLISINDTKDEAMRYQAIRQADIAVLCLPEEVASKTCSDLNEVDTVIIDASTYHRTMLGWTYGFIELNHQQLKNIVKSKRIANPGCFAGGILSVLNPIKDYLNQDVGLVVEGVTGYSAGGKKTIEKQQTSPVGFRTTNLNREHIHVVEVKHYLNLKNKLAFNTSVANFERGQMVTMTLFQEHLDINIDSTRLAYENFYKDFDKVKVMKETPSQLLPETMAGRDDVEIYLSQPSPEYIKISAIYDNLGKGSAGSIAHIIEEILVKK